MKTPHEILGSIEVIAEHIEQATHMSQLELLRECVMLNLARMREYHEQLEEAIDYATYTQTLDQMQRSIDMRSGTKRPD